MDSDVREKLQATLDPEDWRELRAQGHAMLDDMFDYLEQLRARPVWQIIPQPIRDGFHEPLPTGPGDLAAVHRRFVDDILPYAAGNAHPGFMGWVNGGGTPVGMLAEMLAAGLNANLGGRDQIPIAVERQVVEWVREIFRFPDDATGLFVTGTSTASGTPDQPAAAASAASPTHAIVAPRSTTRPSTITSVGVTTRPRTYSGANCSFMLGLRPSSWLRCQGRRRCPALW
ncbi:hypothetical protein GALL_247150 [mine drainage metagenome]|uniref:Uncharacterized protein n=1 Tax=mine drainage metagenome TaxID=410659 RepID=A0A1J5RMX3_9ZZZZ